MSDWLSPALAVSVAGLIIAALSQVTRALNQFRAHVEKQAVLGETVERLDDTVAELRGDMRDLQCVLKNGLNARLAELKHTVEMNQQYCQTRQEHIDGELSRLSAVRRNTTRRKA